MCTTYFVSDTRITSLGELRSFLGCDPIYIDADDWYGPQTDGEFCLCGVDANETARMMGMTCDYDDWGLDLVFTPARTDAGKEG